MDDKNGEIIENNQPPALIKILLAHTSGLIGLILTLIWLTILILVTYIEPFEQDFFLITWYSTGIYLALITIIGDIVQHVSKMILGRIQIVLLIQSINEIITAIALLLLGILYPFDFGELNQLASVLIYVLAILSGLSSITNMYKFFNWDDLDKRSLLSI